MDAAPSTFRSCGSCRSQWATPQDFLDDAGLALIGLQVAAHTPEFNLLVFEHSCGSTVSVLTRRLRFLLPDPEEGGDLPDLHAGEQCRLLCKRIEEWAACDRPCINARDRRLLQVVIEIKRPGGFPTAGQSAGAPPSR